MSSGKLDEKVELKKRDQKKKKLPQPKKQNVPLDEIDWDDAQAIWDYYMTPNSKGEVCNFFSGVEIDEEAGFDEIADFTEGWRPYAAVFYTLWLCFNWFSVLRVSFFGILVSINAPEGSPETAFTISGYIYLLATGNRIPSMLIISSLELITLLTMSAMAIWTLLTAICARSQCIRWHKFAFLAFRLYPISISISAVKLLNFATPTILMPQMLQVISHSTEHNGMIVAVWKIINFLVSRLFCMFIGFDAFLFRFQVLAVWMSGYVQEGDASGVTAEDLVLLTLVFLNNMLGILQLGIFVRDRLFLFIFGGEDGTMSAVEMAKQATWEALIMEHAWHKMPSRFNAIALFLTFSDIDFQRLSLDSTDESMSLDSAAVLADSNGCYTDS